MGGAQDSGIHRGGGTLEVDVVQDDVLWSRQRRNCVHGWWYIEQRELHRGWCGAGWGIVEVAWVGWRAGRKVLGSYSCSCPLVLIALLLPHKRIAGLADAHFPTGKEHSRARQRVEADKGCAW